MSAPKRNRISLARRKALSHPEMVYAIRCPGTHCDCEHFGPDCRRGFFSLWIQAVYGRYFASKLDMPSYVDFGDKPYLYSDPAQYQGDFNFWNYFYSQDLSLREKRMIPNEYIETYPLRIWKRGHFKSVNKLAVQNLVLRQPVKDYIQRITGKVAAQPTLGIHIRGTDHQDEVQQVPLDRYLKLLAKHQRNYQKFYIATDDQVALERLLDEFGEERLIYQQATRSYEKQAVHTNMKHQDRYRLGLEVLADCHALSNCGKALLVHSNVSYGALLLNPKLKYTLMETADSRGKRRKTGFLYTLDRWGIRRM